MKKLIFIFSFFKIRKQEFPEVIDGTIEIVEKHGPVALSIQGMFSLLLVLQSKLPLLTNKAVGHPLTTVLRNQHIRMKELAGSISMQGVAIEKAAVDSMSEAVKLIVPEIRMHLSNLSRENTKVSYQQVNNFIIKLNNNDNLVSAATAIGINVTVDEMKSVVESIKVNKRLRRESKAPGRDVNKVQIKAEMVDAFYRLINSIELARIEHPTIDYAPLINELNVFLIPYQAMVKSRKSQTKTAALKITTAALSSKTDATAI